MALLAAYTGQVALNAVMDRVEPEVGIDDAEESVILGLFAAFIEALYQSQISGNARNRLAESMINAAGDRVAPVTSAVLTDLASKAPIIRNEILSAFTEAGLTPAELLATEGGAHDWTDLAPLH